MVNLLISFNFLFFNNPIFSKENLQITVFPDTLKIVSDGVNNRVVIDSLIYYPGSPDSTLSGISGKIEQTGNANLVKIRQGAKHADSTITNQNVTIKQTGKNNTVKINSQ